MGYYLNLAKSVLPCPTITQEGEPQRIPTRTTGSETRRSEEFCWPPESLDAERRFGQPHAKLFPFLGRKVRTPQGPGTLLQVFADRVTVLLDSELRKCSVFVHREIEPVSGQL